MNSKYQLKNMGPGDLLKPDPSTNPMREMQPYLVFDPQDRRIWISLTHNIDGIPMDVWHGQVRRYPIETPAPDAEALVKMVNDGEFDELLDRIAHGHVVIWDGSNNVGRLTNDADLAEDELIERLENLPSLADRYEGAGLWDAAEWNEPSLPSRRSGGYAEIVEVQLYGLTAQTTDEELMEIVQKLEAEAEEEYVYLSGTEQYIRTIREELQEDADDRNE